MKHGVQAIRRRSVFTSGNSCDRTSVKVFSICFVLNNHILISFYKWKYNQFVTLNQNKY